MRQCCVCFSIYGMLLLLYDVSYGSNASSCIISYQITPINELSISGSSSPFIIDSMPAGSAYKKIGHNGTHYSLTTNQSAKKITAALDNKVQNGLVLTINLDVPQGWKSEGEVELTDTAVNIASGDNATASNLSIKYGFMATVGAGRVNNCFRTMTLTVCDQ